MLLYYLVKFKNPKMLPNFHVEQLICLTEIYCEILCNLQQKYCELHMKIGTYIPWVRDTTSRNWNFEFRPLMMMMNNDDDSFSALEALHNALYKFKTYLLTYFYIPRSIAL